MKSILQMDREHQLDRERRYMFCCCFIETLRTFHPSKFGIERNKTIILCEAITFFLYKCTGLHYAGWFYVPEDQSKNSLAGILSVEQLSICSVVRILSESAVRWGIFAGCAKHLVSVRLCSDNCNAYSTACTVRIPPRSCWRSCGLSSGSASRSSRSRCPHKLSKYACQNATDWGLRLARACSTFRNAPA